jgi:hypothetical protein
MTYPANQGNNNMGPFFNDGITPVNVSPASPPAAPPAVPKSPSGALSADAPPPQFDTGEMITQQFLSGIGENIPQQGVPAQTTQPHIAGVPDSQIAWNNATAGNGSTGNKCS